MRNVARLAALAALTLSLSACSLLTSGDTEVEVGECIDSSIVNEAEAEVTDLPTVDCAEPHDGEVFYNFETTVSPFSLEAIWADAESTCEAQFEGYVGTPYADSIYYFAYLYPTEDLYASGDRTISCILTSDGNSRLEGSAKGSGL